MNKDIVKYTDWLSFYLYQPIAYLILNQIKNSGITPNQITFLSLVLGITGGICLFLDNEILSIIFLNISFVLDCLDGQLARYKQMFSSFGMLLDNISDRIVESIFISAVIYKYSLYLEGIAILISYWLYAYISDIIVYSNGKYKKLTLKEKIVFAPVYFLNRSFIVLILSISVFSREGLLTIGILSVIGVAFRFYREIDGRL